MKLVSFDYLLLYTTVLLNIFHFECVQKRFVSSWDFSRTKNWKNGALPCSGRSVTFKTQPEFSIFVDRKAQLRSIDFSFDIEIIFGKNSSLELNINRDSSCIESFTESIFENKAKGYWWDPESWSCDEAGKKYGCNSAVPHILRVPCQSDAVVLQNVNDSVYNVIFTDPVPTVRELLLGEQNLTTSKFFEFSVSTEGQQRISKRYSSHSRTITPLYIEGEGVCTDITGCQCHVTPPVRQICSLMRSKCPRLTCSLPIKMKGFCCEICGAEITITHNGSIALSSVEDLLERVLKLDEGRGVNGFAAKMSHDFFHVYFVPQQDTVDYTGAVSLFSELFSRELNANGHHYIASYLATGTVAEMIAKEKHSYVAAIFVSIFIILVAIFAVYLYKKRRMNELPFMFRRMSIRSLSMRSTRSTSIPSSAHVAAFSASDGRSFINPTFGQDRISSFPSLPALEGCVINSSEAEGPSERENPMYSVQMGQGISFKSLKTTEVKDLATEDKAEKTKEVESPPEEVEDISVTDESATQSELISIDIEDEQDEEPVDDDDIDPLELLAKSRVEKSFMVERGAEEAEKDAKKNGSEEIKLENKNDL